jgi:hypothetical protein
MIMVASDHPRLRGTSLFPFRAAGTEFPSPSIQVPARPSRSDQKEDEGLSLNFGLIEVKANPPKNGIKV